MVPRCVDVSCDRPLGDRPLGDRPPHLPRRADQGHLMLWRVVVPGVLEEGFSQDGHFTGTNSAQPLFLGSSPALEGHVPRCRWQSRNIGVGPLVGTNEWTCLLKVDAVPSFGLWLHAPATIFPQEAPWGSVDPFILWSLKRGIPR